jgi:hypothetical protein
MAFDYTLLMQARARFEERIVEAEAENRARQVQRTAADPQARQPGLWTRITNLLPLRSQEQAPAARKTTARRS